MILEDELGKLLFLPLSWSCVPFMYCVYYCPLVFASISVSLNSISIPSHSYSSFKTNVCIWLTSFMKPSLTTLSYKYFSCLSHHCISSHYHTSSHLPLLFLRVPFPPLLFMYTFYLASRTNSVSVFSATSSLVFSLFRTIPSSVAMTHCFC